MNDRDDDPTNSPTQSREQATEEGAWMTQNGIRIAVFSILGTLLLALALMQGTGLIDPLGAVVDTRGGEWAVIAVVGLAVIAIGLWSWLSPREHRER